MEVRADMELAGYLIVSLIGRGGMGSVYRAQQTRLRREVALKIMAPDLAGDPVFRERFLRESQIAASLDHPNVVPIFDAGEVDGLLYLAMRYIPGSDLRSRVRHGGPLAPDVVVSIIEQIASALDAAHELGLVHRDVKPSNVLVVEDGRQSAIRAYLTDFGLSKLVVESTGGTVGRPLGSVHYMSPEQIRGERVDRRADVYSLGCLLFECLTGEVPFPGDSEVAVLYAHLESPPPRASDRGPALPPAIDDVLASALAKSPAARPAGALELAAATAAALRGASQRRAPPVARVASEAAQATGTTTRRRERRPIVGRLKEVNELSGLLEDALGGHGGIVLLTGDAGIGKTTLARLATDHAQRRGALAVWASGSTAGIGAPPYWHWVQVVRALLRRPEGPQLVGDLGPAAEWLAAIAPELAHELGAAEPAATPADPTDRAYEVYDALTRLLARAATGSALLVVLDDLQFADEASLRALAFIASLVGEMPVLIVATYRGAELRHASGAPLLEPAGPGHTISLEGLDSEQIAKLIEARTGRAAAEDLVRRIHDVTGGNPLFVSELLNLLEAQGRLADPALLASALPLPTGVRDAIVQRLAPLSDRGREALTVGAVIGASFRATTIAAVTGLHARELLELLDHAARLGLVRPQTDLPDGYTFSHGLIQATLYESLARGRRISLHAAVGEALERSYDVVAGEGLAEIAHHFLEAAPIGDTERAVVYARRAAERATQMFAYEQAVSLYTRAITFADPARAGERIALLQSLGEAQMRAGDTEGARDTLQRAAEVARAHDDAPALARAALACGIWGLSLGIDQPLVHLAEEAVQRLERSGPAGLLASVKGLLAAALYWSDEVARRERLAADALTLARAEHERARTGESRRTLAYVIGRYLLTRWGPDSAQADFPLSDELLDHVRALRDTEQEILIRNWRISVLSEIGSFAAVDQEIASVDEMASELRQPRAMLFAPLHHGCRAATAGEFAEAERLNAKSVAIATRVGGTIGDLAATAQLLSIRIQQGRVGELEEAVRALANRHPGMVALQCTLALILVQSGRRAQARAELERLTSAGVSGFPRDNTHILMLALISEVAADLGDQERSRLLHSWLEPYAGRWVVSPGAAALWPVDRTLGRLATIHAPPEVALALIHRAREQAAGVGALPSLALAALDEAHLLSLRGGPEDAAGAAALAAKARTLAQDLGMGLVVDAATLLEVTTPSRSL